jgi:lysophospholipase L1-like esterase
MSVSEKDIYLKDLGLLLSKIWPENRTVNIICHGHSVPCGYFGFHCVNTFNAYPHILHQKLKERYPMAVINMLVTGIGGENSEKGAKRFGSDVLTHNPDLITLDYGLNDFEIGLTKAGAAWTSMIEKALAKNIKVILLTPTGEMPDFSVEHDIHANQIRNLADTYSIGLADSSEAFAEYCKNSGKLSDLMSWINHPNRKGHELVAERILRNFPIPSPGENLQ